MLQEDKWSLTHRDTENHSQEPKRHQTDLQQSGRVCPWIRNYRNPVFTVEWLVGDWLAPSCSLAPSQARPGRRPTSFPTIKSCIRTHNYEKSTRNHEKPAFTLSWSTRQLLWLWSYSEQPTIMMVRVMANTLLSQPHNQHLIIKVVIEVVMCLWSLS